MDIGEAILREINDAYGIRIPLDKMNTDIAREIFDKIVEENDNYGYCPDCDNIPYFY